MKLNVIYCVIILLFLKSLKASTKLINFEIDIVFLNIDIYIYTFLCNYKN